jgi:hypothetical protein
LADSVGLALLVVLQTLSPPERLAYVLHDMFDVPFDEIAPIVERSPPGAGSRHFSRRRTRPPARSRGRLPRRRPRRRPRDARDGARSARRAPGRSTGGNRRRIDGTPRRAGSGQEGPRGGRTARAALVDGAVGVVVAPRGRLLMVLRFTFRDGKIVEIDAIADPARLRRLDLTVLED